MNDQRGAKYLHRERHGERKEVEIPLRVWTDREKALLAVSHILRLWGMSIESIVQLVRTANRLIDDGNAFEKAYYESMKGKEVK